MVAWKYDVMNRLELIHYSGKGRPSGSWAWDGRPGYRCLRRNRRFHLAGKRSILPKGGLYDINRLMMKTGKANPATGLGENPLRRAMPKAFFGSQS
jgi:hypothetical protein